MANHIWVPQLKCILVKRLVFTKKWFRDFFYVAWKLKQQKTVLNIRKSCCDIQPKLMLYIVNILWHPIKINVTKRILSNLWWTVNIKHKNSRTVLFKLCYLLHDWPEVFLIYTYIRIWQSTDHVWHNVVHSITLEHIVGLQGTF